MSLSASQDNAFLKNPSGKTPPPAPSAGFAKRAQIQPDTGARYRPPALRSGNSPPNLPLEDLSSTTAADTSTLPPTNYPAGFRRARAGTLPSNVQLAAQRYASTLTHVTHSMEMANAPPPPSQTSSTLARPGLRHASTTTPSLAAERNANSRLRSGSLSTLPPTGISSSGNSSAFGSSLYSSSWLNNQGGYPVLDELRSVSNESVPGDDVHTLDYLGLDDRARPPPATVSELRTQAQAAIAGRLRATTVSNPYRNRPPLQALVGTGTEEDLQEVEEYDTQGPYRSRVDSFDTGVYYNSTSPYVAKGFKQTSHLGVNSRPRATSVGTLEDPSRARYAEMNSLHSHSINAASASSILRSLAEPKAQASAARLSTHINNVRFSTGDVNAQTPTRATLQTSFLHPQPGQPQPRSLSPNRETPQIQTPSRSLWIGNLDNTASKEILLTVFSPYGAIESLRLLPEKECGFVNFLDINDAVRAKDDVLNRLGGNIGLPNGQPVRIGFGKADSAPAQPAKTPASAAPGGGPTTVGGMEVQSTPTRALWIGSIPSSTTPATILSLFAPYGPIESARVLTHKNCGFVNFERLDDAVRARKALNGRDVLGPDVGAIRIGYARVPTKTNGTEAGGEDLAVGVQGVGDLTVGATIHALRSVKGATTIPADQQVLGGAVENYRSNLLLSMIGSGNHNISDGQPRPSGWTPSVTEQQMIMRELSAGVADAEADIQALADFRPPMMYYTSIPSAQERPLQNRRWDAAKLRDLRKRLDANVVSPQEVEEVAHDMMDGEIVDLASDWLGNTVVQKLFEKCIITTRVSMLEHLAPHLATIGVHKNGTWAAQKVIECVATPEEVALIAQNLRPYTPPLLLDQFGNYVVQCCLRFGSPANDFIFDSMIDRLWEIAQGRFGARSMRACLESQHITVNQQLKIATAVILNSIPLATNPNGALLLTWLLETSNFPARFTLLAPRFTPHLSHLCTHKLASLTVLRIVNQKIEPEASLAIVRALFNSPGDHVLADVLGDQVNGVAVVHKILGSQFIDPAEKPQYLEATKRVLIELKASPTQSYRRLMEEVGIPVPAFQQFPPMGTGTNSQPRSAQHSTATTPYGQPAALQGGYMGEDHGLAPMMAGLSINQGGHSPSMGFIPHQLPPQQGQYNNIAAGQGPRRGVGSPGTFSPNSDPFNPFAMPSPDVNSGGRSSGSRRTAPTTPQMQSQSMSPAMQYGMPAGANVGMQQFGGMPMQGHPGAYQQPGATGYMYPMYQPQPPGGYSQ